MYTSSKKNDGEYFRHICMMDVRYYTEGVNGRYLKNNLRDCIFVSNKKCVNHSCINSLFPIKLRSILFYKIFIYLL